MLTIYTVWYNFVRIHKTPKCTPAMVAGVSRTALEHGGHRGTDRYAGGAGQAARTI